MRPLEWLDPWVLRRPFEGAAAARYTRHERPAFGDLDDRLLAAMRDDLLAARVLVDLGAGGGELAARAAALHPHLQLVTVEPGRDFRPGLRARAEALPLATASADVALCLSSLRHVADRAAALRELRRVVRPGGVAFVVELDAEAGAARTARHTRAMTSAVSRAAFRLVVLPTTPGPERFAAAARAAGWRTSPAVADPSQPFFVLRLT